MNGPFGGAPIRELARLYSASFSQSNFMPHGHCYLWQPDLVWTHVVSDFLIGLAYVIISTVLYFLVRKIRLPFSGMVLSFGVFIAACGATHFMEIWTLWQPDYWASGGVKVLTAVASVATGIWLIRLRPQIVDIAESVRVVARSKAELERSNAELEERTRELQAKNALLAEQHKMLAHSARMSALGEMASGIAHEINSPLGIITVHANQLERFLKRGTLTPEVLSKEAQLIAATAKRIGAIITGLRTFAREGDNDPFEILPVDRVLQDAVVLCQTRMRSHGVELRVDVVPPELTIECRAVQIGQVLLNLLNNAYDAVLPLQEKWVHITAKKAEDRVRLIVTDSGPGIDPSIRHKIMQPFFTTKEVGHGTGLGLSISRGIAEAHGGTLELDQTSEHTRFIVDLPRQQSAMSEAQR